MGLLKKIADRIEAKLDEIRTCPDCGHNDEKGTLGCSCQRSDCSCSTVN